MNKVGFVTGLNKPIPERIREARRARGLTITELATRVSVSRQAISQYELGHSSPSGDVMTAIVQVLEFPLSFYFKSKEDQRVNASALFFRSLKSATRVARDMFEIRTDWIEEIYQYLNQYVQFPDPDIPNFEKFMSTSTRLSGAEIDKIASLTREHWGLGMGPINDVVLAVEKHGFIVARNSLTEHGLDACSQWKSGRPYIFLGSYTTSACRLRFDVAHELGHLLLHSHVAPEDLAVKSVMDRLEKEANRFASVFLMPFETFAQEVMSTSLNHFLHLKSRWKVSVAAMLYRCSDLGLLTDNQVLYLRKQLSRLGRKVEPLDDTIPHEEPRLLMQAMKLLLEHEVVTTHQVLNDLSLPPSEIEMLTNLPRGTLTQRGKVIPLTIKKRMD